MKRTRLPRYLQIEPTRRCNLNCIMCARQKNIGKVGDLSIENLRVILERFNSVSIKEVNFTGMGESFLNKNIYEFLDIAGHYPYDARVEVFSNGLIPIDIDKLFPAIVGKDFRITFSINGSNLLEFEKIHRNINFQIFKKNLDNFSNNEIQGYLEFGASTLWFEDLTIRAALEWRKELGFKEICLFRLNNRFNENFSFEPTPENIENAKTIAKELKLELGIFEPKPPCRFPSDVTYIDWQGNVTPCCNIPLAEDYCFGNLLEQDLEEVWFGEKAENFREEVSNQTNKICGDCQWLKEKN